MNHDAPSISSGLQEDEVLNTTIIGHEMTEENARRIHPTTEEVDGNQPDACFIVTTESEFQNENSLHTRGDRNRMVKKKKKKKNLLSGLKEYGTSVTSLDLSENYITDAAVESLFKVLAEGWTPNLIYVNLKRNPITCKSEETLNQMRQLREHMKVDFDLDLRREEKPSPKVIEENLGGKRCIQANPASSSNSRMLSSNNLQRKIESAIQAIKQSSLKLNVSDLTNKFREIIIFLSQQVYSCHKDREWTTPEKLPEGLPILLENLDVFLTILDMNPDLMTTQKKLEESCAGFHRVALVELLNLLLVPSSPLIEHHFLQHGAPKRMVALFFEFPWNVFLQGATFRALQAMLDKKSFTVQLLDGSNNLAILLAKTGTSCASFPMDKRPGYAGYVVKLTTEVQVWSKKNSDAKILLENNCEWCDYIGPSNVFRNLMIEQLAYLGGCRPYVVRTELPPDAQIGNSSDSSTV